MDPLSEAELDVAEDRGREMLADEPRAKSAKYDFMEGRIVVELINGCSYAFPVRLAQDLNGASDVDLSKVIVDGAGFNLHWPSLQADLYVPALVSGLFGNRTWMTRELARRAGQATSPAKIAAARANGAKGGRPRKTA